ncbi:MAG: hypothetical protein IJX33_03425 [Akkermansia sp.]|nr:hypothetical protein [Akkermansia sp.]
MMRISPLLLSLTLLTLSCCSFIQWQTYKEAALAEGYVPIPPEELYPDDPEQGTFDGIPYLAGEIIEGQQRAKILKAMQQAAQVRIIQTRAATSDIWSPERKERELPAVPMNDALRTLAQRWSTAPEWLQLTFVNFDIAGVFLTNDCFCFLDEAGNELGRLHIHTLDTVCKPEGQKHYDDMREMLYKAAGCSPQW